MTTFRSRARLSSDQGAMVFLLLTVLSLALICGTAPSLAAGGGDVLLEERIDSDQWGWEKATEGGHYLTAKGYRNLNEIGQPRLPFRELLLLIPSDRDVAEAWIEPLSVRLEKGAAMPQRSAGYLTSMEERHPVARLERVDGAFPAQWGEYAGTYSWHGYRLLGMNLYPVRSLESEDGHSLEYLEAYAVRVRYTDGGSTYHTVQRERFVAGERESAESVLKNLVANPGALASYARATGIVVEDAGPFKPSRTPSLTGSAVQYVIVTNEAMKDAFQVLADFKTQLGITTVVVTTEFIADNYRNGADIQETIRIFLQDAYAKWGTEYVLLGGDTEVLPARYVTNTFYPSGSHTDVPVDLYFAALDGNWNANGNALFGEVAEGDLADDEADFAEELYLGRATVTTPAQAENFVAKVMDYQQASSSADWPNRILYAAEVLFPDPWSPPMDIFLDGASFSEEMISELVEPCSDMEYMRMYETDQENVGDAQLTRAALIDSLNTGHYGICNQIGHGYYYNMSVGDNNFLNADADNLINDNYFALYSLNCASAAFDFSCLMERFLQNPHGGSVISIGSARAAFIHTKYYQEMFFSQLLCGGENPAGRLLALSRLPFLVNTAYNSVDRWTFENYSLLGDPTLPIWSGAPVAINVATGTLSPGPNSLPVTVTNAMGAPVSDVTVCLQRDGEDHVVGVTDANGQVTLDYLVSGPGQVDLTVSGRNTALTTTSLSVASGGTYFEFWTNAIEDQGNGNAALEAGETLTFLPVLRETMGTGTNGLSGTLSCAQEGVTIPNPTADFVDVEAEGGTYPTTRFIIQLASDLADGTPLEFVLNLTDSNGDQYTVEWTERVLAPEPEVVLVDWEDSTYGNGDGVLDDGERVVVQARLKNFGAGRLDAAELTLSTMDAGVTLFQTGASVEALDLMETSPFIGPFSLALDDASERALMTLSVTDNYGRVADHVFHLRRPAAPSGITTDTSLGSGIIALRWEPLPDSDIYGYNVYRSSNASGPFEKVNRDIIAGTSYFRDEGLEQLTRYFYQVEALSLPRVPSVLSSVVEQATSPAEIPGLPLEFNTETSSHMAVGDVDGDGDNEMVLVSDEVYVWHHDGSELLNGDGDSQTLGVFTDLDMTLSPAGVALAELDGEPGLEMVVSALDPPAIYVFKSDGSVCDGWPRSLAYGAGAKWNWATPAVGDVDGDGDDEIVVNTLNGQTFAFHHDGTEVLDGDADPATEGVFLRRPGATSEWLISSPTLVDLDGDGAREIVFGTGEDDLGPARVEARKADGSSLEGFPYNTGHRINSSVAAADLDGDGIMELVVSDIRPRLFVIEQDGTDYPGFPIDLEHDTMFGPMPSVALGDLDGDGQLEIVYVGNIHGDASVMIAVDTDREGGTSGSIMSGWPKNLPGSSESSPVIGDINGDDVPDILFGIGGGDEEAPNNLYAFESDGTPISGFPITLAGPLMPAPIICDLDLDLDVDIVMGGWDRLVHVWDMPYAFDRRYVSWGTFAGNMKRDGVYTSHWLVGVESDQDVPAAGLVLGDPYPNPFNPSTSVRLHVPAGRGGGTLELVVYDLQGRKVRTLHSGKISSGWHTMVWDGRDDGGRGQSSGMYFMRAVSGSQESIHKMTLVK
ncbi:hypothetical protein CSB20_07825 [bacterium DOLZORAL124_64_63]|nr:MAG: hypothetical protein CSB20_07825 [bacterium DOLZORAL124_64_63]